MAKVNDLELKFEAQSTTQLQNQIDALNGAMGDLTNRLVGFTTEIDTNVLTAGQVLVTVDARLTPDGAQLDTFQPVDYSRTEEHKSQLPLLMSCPYAGF